MKILETALTAIHAGEKIILDGQNNHSVGNIVEKTPHDYQTATDVRIEERIGEIILKEYPHHTIFGEEVFGQTIDDQGTTWFIDPIDGTRNFIQGRDDFVISLAAYEKGEPLLGILSFPNRKIEIIAAAENPFVTINGEPIHKISLPENLSKSLVGIPGETNPKENREKLTGAISKLINKIEGFRISGAVGYDLGAMAMGELDARLSYDVKPVDVAAGAYIVMKVGGKVTDLQGNRYLPSSRTILAAVSCTLHDEILAALY